MIYIKNKFLIRKKKDKVIEHLFMGDSYKLRESYDTQINIVKSMIFAMNSKQKLIREELIRAMKNVLFKYYEFNMATEGLLTWSDNPDFNEKKDEKNSHSGSSSSSSSHKKDDKAAAGPIYKIICEKKGMKKRQDNRGVLWEPVIVKVNVGVPRKEIRIVDGDEETEAVVDLEIDCSGLLLDGAEVYHSVKEQEQNKDKDKDKKDKEKDTATTTTTTNTNEDKEKEKYNFKVNIIDDQTISISGYKKQMKYNNSTWEYLNVSHTFKLKKYYE